MPDVQLTSPEGLPRMIPESMAESLIAQGFTRDAVELPKELASIDEELTPGQKAAATRKANKEAAEAEATATPTGQQ